VDFETHGPAGNDFQGDTIDLSALFDSWTDFAGANANEAWAQGYLYFKAYGSEEAPTRGVSVYIDINGHAPNEGFVDLEAVRLANVSLDEIGTIGREFLGLHYNFIV
jgi:hypothetical protein